MCSVTPFGQDGPWRDYQTSDLVHLAAGGQMASSGYDEEDVPGAPPIAPGGGNAWHIASHYSYMSIMAALYHLDLTGEGQYIDVSVHEACCLTTEGAIAIYLSTGEVVRRHTGRHASPDQSPGIQFATQDGGWINTTRSGTNLTPARLRILAEWMDSHGLAADLMDEKYQDPAVLEQGGQHFSDVFQNFFANMPLIEAYEGGQERRLPLGRHPHHGRNRGQPPLGRPQLLHPRGAPRTGTGVHLPRPRRHLQRLPLAHLPPRPPYRRAQPGNLRRRTGPVRRRD